MRNYRVYATEDLNLEIYYTFDGQWAKSEKSPKVVPGWLNWLIEVGTVFSSS